MNNNYSAAVAALTSWFSSLACIGNEAGKSKEPECTKPWEKEKAFRP